MTSKISTHNISLGMLMRENLRRRTWMAALSLLGSFITCPVAFLFYISLPTSDLPDEIQRAEQTAERIYEYLCSGHLIMQMTVIYIGAFITAIYGFQYLYSRKTVDMYHSMPVTRSRLFWTVYIDGLLIWLVPFLLGNLSVCLLSLHAIGMPAYWPGVTVLLLKEAVLLPLCFLILYNACLVPVMFSGNAGNAFLNTLIFGLSVLCCYLTGLGYMCCYLDTFYVSSDQICPLAVVGLSPLASPVYLCVYFVERSTGLANPQQPVPLTDSQWAFLLLCVTAVMLFHLALAVVLYKRRPSELAERGVENRWFRIPLRFAASLLAGLLLSLFFGVLIGTLEPAWIIFGAVFGCTLAFAIMNILHHASFKAVLSHRLQLLATLAVTCAIVLCFRFDVFGYDAYLPDKDSITGLSLFSYQLKGQVYGLQKDSDGYYVRTSSPNLRDTVVFTDAEENYRLLKLLVDANSGEVEEDLIGEYRYTLTVRVNTTSGSYNRIYNFYQTPESLEALRPFVESEVFRTAYYPAESGTIDPPSQIIGKSMDKSNVLINEPEKIEQLYRAYAMDFAEHFDLNSAAFAGYPGLVTLQYMYPRSQSGEFTDYHYLNMNVPAWYDRTLALLRQWNPEFPWSLEDVEIQSLQVMIDNSDCEYDLSDPLALKHYLGEGTDSPAGPNAPAKAAASGETAVESDGSYSWNRLLTARSDSDELERLKPYLYLGYRGDRAFMGDDYVPIGKLKAVSPYHPEDVIKCLCYMKKGEIPEGFAESLRWSETDSEN